MTFASQLFITEDSERAFRGEVETMLRAGDADGALAAIDAKIGQLPENTMTRLALSVQADDVSLLGWNTVASSIEELDRHGQPISAIGIDFIDAARAGAEPDPEGRLEPALETVFYCDDAFAFTQSDRSALNAAYGRAGARWQGAYDHRDDKVRVRGLSVIYGACVAIRPHMERGELTELADYDAPRLAAMRCAVLLHMAVAAKVREDGLPRAMVVLCGSDGDYPFFDAPVTTRGEYEDARDAEAEDGGADEALFTSLATLAPVRPNVGYRFTPETEHVSGRSLRHRLVREVAADADDDTLDLTEAYVAEEARQGQSLLGRIFRRSA